jgi:hypothetical protein
MPKFTNRIVQQKDIAANIEDRRKIIPLLTKLLLHKWMIAGNPWVK